MRPIQVWHLSVFLTPINKFWQQAACQKLAKVKFLFVMRFKTRKVGSIEITLIQPSIGEILRTQWLAILASLFLHVYYGWLTAPLLANA